MPFTRPFLLCLLAAAAGCTGDGFTAADLTPPLALSGSIAIEPRIEARVVLPITNVSDGRVALGLWIRNGLAETVVSGACADRVDAKPRNGPTWFDVTPTSQVCTSQLVSFAPGVPSTIGVSADQAKLRVIAGGAGQTLVIRVRHVVSSTRDRIDYGVQSAEQELTVP